MLRKFKGKKYRRVYSTGFEDVANRVKEELWGKNKNAIVRKSGNKFSVFSR